MSSHRSTVVGHGDAWQAKCSCGWRSSVEARADAVDEQDQHQQQVARARVGLKRQPSLEETLVWFTHQAANSANTPEERAQWEQLAKELQHRIGQQTADTPLWE